MRHDIIAALLHENVFHIQGETTSHPCNSCWILAWQTKSAITVRYTDHLTEIVDIKVVHSKQHRRIHHMYNNMFPFIHTTHTTQPFPCSARSEVLGSYHKLLDQIKRLKAFKSNHGSPGLDGQGVLGELLLFGS